MAPHKAVVLGPAVSRLVAPVAAVALWAGAAATAARAALRLPADKLARAVALALMREPVERRRAEAVASAEQRAAAALRVAWLAAPVR